MAEVIYRLIILIARSEAVWLNILTQWGHQGLSDGYRLDTTTCNMLEASSLVEELNIRVKTIRGEVMDRVELADVTRVNRDQMDGARI